MIDAKPRDTITQFPNGWLPWRIGPVRALLLATAILLLIFLIFPGLDRWFSRQFYVEGSGFPAAEIPALIWLRGVAELTLWAAVIVMVGTIIIKLVRPDRPTPIPPTKIVFLFSTLALGPGLLVNVILKNNWGRPRPIAVETFGGDLPFVGIWPISGHCDSNCSFVSGEASSAIWLLAFAVLVPLAWRNRVVIIALVLAFMFSLNRIAFGGHFLSDVVLSWTLTLLIIAIVYHFLFVRPIPALGSDRLEATLTRFGQSIHGRLGVHRRKSVDDPDRD